VACWPGASAVYDEEAPGRIGLYICLFTILVAIIAPVIATHDPLYQLAQNRLQAPSTAHLFGTDEFGRDIYSRIVYGASISVTVAFLSVGIATSIGFILGIISGYYTGWVDNTIQRIVEIKLAFPGLIFAMLLVAIWGAGLEKVILALSVAFLPRTVRTIRGTVLSIRENMYVDAARAIGAGDLRIMFRHIMPNATAPFLIIASTLLGAAILAETSLSFLGLGVPPPASSWGRMLSGGAQTYGAIAPWMVIAPGAAITILVFGVQSVRRCAARHLGPSPAWLSVSSSIAISKCA
jgi:peptide/nickel transport system permease protein